MTKKIPEDIESQSFEHLMKTLTPKQKKFVLAYDGGTGAEMAERLQMSAQSVWSYLGNPRIRRAIKLRGDKEGLSDLVAGRLERQLFWTMLMRDEKMPVDLRIKASQLLGKSEADFIEKKVTEETKTVNVNVNSVSLGERLDIIKQVSGEVIDVKAEEPLSLLESEDYDFLD